MNGQCEKIGELVAEYSTPLQRLPQGITTVKIAIIEKKGKRAGDDEKGKWRETRPRFHSFPFPSSPACFVFFFSPASLRHKEASAEESYKVILQKYI